MVITPRARNLTITPARAQGGFTRSVQKEGSGNSPQPGQQGTLDGSVAISVGCTAEAGM